MKVLKMYLRKMLKGLSLSLKAPKQIMMGQMRQNNNNFRNFQMIQKIISFWAYKVENKSYKTSNQNCLFKPMPRWPKKVNREQTLNKN